jgi:hypothetical protein
MVEVVIVVPPPLFFGVAPLIRIGREPQYTPCISDIALWGDDVMMSKVLREMGSFGVYFYRAEGVT